MAQTAPLVLAPRDSALLAMKRDAVQAPTPRHAPRRVRTSSCETKKGKPVIEAAARATGRGGPQRQNRTIVLLLTRPQAEQLGEEGSGAPFL